MNTPATLSYLIVTRNKLPYLKVILGKLISQKKIDEDIYVADGASSDGTKEYLYGLKQTGTIDYYISEPDFGVAHAINKLILASTGTLIKLITDDDAFHYPAIAACKAFMIQHENIDLVNTEGGLLNSRNYFKTLRYADEYGKWKKDRKPFAFSELGVMFRRSALPVLGLRDPMIKRADAEMSLKLTSGKAAIAWYTGYSYVNIMNKQSVSLIHMKEMKLETDRLKKFYLNENPDNFFVEKIKIIRNKVRMLTSMGKPRESAPGKSWTELLASAEKWLEQRNVAIRPEFITNL